MGFLGIVLKLFTIFKYGWPFMLLVWIFFCKVKWKQFPLEAIIIEKRNNNLIKTRDRLGKYVDKFTGLTGYKLMKANENIPVINFDLILHNADKPTNILEKLIKILRPDIGTVFLFRYGSKQYKPLLARYDDNVERTPEIIKGEDGKEVIVYMYKQFDPRGSIGVIDFEVVDWDNMNFLVQEIRSSEIRRKSKGDWLKTIAVPAVMVAAALLLSIIMVKFGYDSQVSLASTPRSQPTQTQPQQATVPDLPSPIDVVPGK